MIVEPLKLPEVLKLTPRRFRDDRGYFSETYNKRTFGEAVGPFDFVQDNQSYSAQKHTLRGLHFQAPPFAQAKLVRVLQGRIFDVAVDVRAGSPRYGQWDGAELSAEDGEQLFVPEGFLHGFLTLEPDTVVAYKVNAHYDKQSEGSVLWSDKDIGIEWGAPADTVMLSEKDADAAPFRSFDTPFVYKKQPA
ncbi:MAG: dTDP-4-dehydrorhamnose 3,5-epimerase [Pseudomonadota bacterium]